MIEEKVSVYLQEQRKRNTRQCNLIIHNIPESKSTDNEVRENHEMEQASDVFEELEVEDTTIIPPVRLLENLMMSTRDQGY